MIVKKEIKQNLVIINNLYNKSTVPMTTLLHSKLAVLELCGWIEESMDDIVRTCAKRHLKEQANINLVESRVIKRTSGFDYEEYFRPMLIQIIGIIKLERLERNLDQKKFPPLKSTLSTLTYCRNREAHTHLQGTTITRDAPSKTMKNLDEVYDGLKDIEKKLRKLKI